MIKTLFDAVSRLIKKQQTPAPGDLSIKWEPQPGNHEAETTGDIEVVVPPPKMVRNGNAVPPVLDDEYFDAVGNALNTFSRYEACFTVSECVERLDLEGYWDELEQRLLLDNRFVLLEADAPGGGRFIADYTLFRWWTRLSLRLAQLDQVKLSRKKLAIVMSSLRMEGRWLFPPDGAIEFGQRFGFVSPTWDSDHYVFPWAKVLSVVSPASTKLLAQILKAFAFLECRDAVLMIPSTEWLDSGLSRFDERTVKVVRAREGLDSGRKATLEQIGKEQGVTRERIRQIEAKFWKDLRYHWKKRREPFFVAFANEFIKRQGSLILHQDSEDFQSVHFIVKCLNLPLVELPDYDMAVIGKPKAEHLKIFKELAGKFPNLDSSAIAECLIQNGWSYLPSKDLKELADLLSERINQNLTKAQKVYLALKSTERPAHYTRVTEAYNAMFPDDIMSHHNIHSILSRCAAPDFEQYGIVWIGAKGMYALKEWGYERPLQGIHDTVADIVTQKYEENGRPVKLDVIIVEVGKYRSIVQSASVSMAAHLNPRLRRVSKDAFVPRRPDDPDDIDALGDELDEILTEFEGVGKLD